MPQEYCFRVRVSPWRCCGAPLTECEHIQIRDKLVRNNKKCLRAIVFAYVFRLVDVAQLVRISLRCAIMVVCARAAASPFIFTAVRVTSLFSLSRTTFSVGLVVSFWCAFEASVLRFRACAVALLSCLDLTFSLRSPSQLRVFSTLWTAPFCQAFSAGGWVLFFLVLVFRRTFFEMLNPSGIR